MLFSIVKYFTVIDMTNHNQAYSCFGRLDKLYMFLIVLIIMTCQHNKVTLHYTTVGIADKCLELWMSKEESKSNGSILFPRKHNLSHMKKKEKKRTLFYIL